MSTNHNRPYEVIVPGMYFCDLVFTGLPRMPELGKELFCEDFQITPGGAYHSVNALTRLEIHTGWIADFGNDFFSRYIFELIQQSGIDTRLMRHHDFPTRNVSVSLSFPKDRAFVSFMDVVEFPPEHEIVAQYQPDFVLLPGLTTGAYLEAFLKVTSPSGIKMYMDCQHTDLTLDSEEVIRALGAVDYFAPNLAEALQLTGEKSAEAALSQLSKITATVIIKCGADGSLAQHGSEIFHVPAIPVKPVDTTGAGDCFNAGFLFGCLRHENLENCLRFGNIAGGLSTTAPGSQAAPTASKILRYFS